MIILKGGSAAENRAWDFRRRDRRSNLFHVQVHIAKVIMSSNIKSLQISNQNFFPPKNVAHTRVSGSDYRLTVDGYSGNAGDTLRWDIFAFCFLCCFSCLWITVNCFCDFQEFAIKYWRRHFSCLPNKMFLHCNNAETFSGLTTGWRSQRETTTKTAGLGIALQQEATADGETESSFLPYHLCKMVRRSHHYYHNHNPDPNNEL